MNVNGHVNTSTADQNSVGTINLVIEEDNTVICKGPCKCTKRTIANCRISKDLGLVTPNTMSRAEKLHQMRINNRKGRTLLQQWVLDKDGRRSHLIKSDNICPEPEPVNTLVQEQNTETAATTTATAATTRSTAATTTGTAATSTTTDSTSTRSDTTSTTSSSGTNYY